MEAPLRVGRMTLDPRGFVTDANLEAAEIAGMNQSDLIGHQFPLLIEWAGRMGEPFDFTFDPSTGVRRHLRVVGTNLPDSTAATHSPVTISFVDLSENREIRNELESIRDGIRQREKTETEIEQYQNRLRSIASQQSLTEERERRRIATELHDRISQNLVSANIQLSVLIDSELGEADSQQIRHVRSVLTEAIHNTRSITSELSPPVLYEQPLGTALEWLAEQASRNYHLKIDFRITANDAEEGRGTGLPDDVQVVLFRGTQELLRNCHLHAHARKVEVRMIRSEAGLRVDVIDDGIGFAPGEPAEDRGNGLFLLGERMKQMGGSLSIRSGPGEGTCITMLAPDNGAWSEKQEEPSNRTRRRHQ